MKWRRFVRRRERVLGAEGEGGAGWAFGGGGESWEEMWGGGLGMHRAWCDQPGPRMEKSRSAMNSSRVRKGVGRDCQ